MLSFLLRTSVCRSYANFRHISSGVHSVDTETSSSQSVCRTCQHSRFLLELRYREKKCKTLFYPFPPMRRTAGDTLKCSFTVKLPYIPISIIGPSSQWPILQYPGISLPLFLTVKKSFHQSVGLCQHYILIL